MADALGNRVRRLQLPFLASRYGPIQKRSAPSSIHRMDQPALAIGCECIDAPVMFDSTLFGGILQQPNEKCLPSISIMLVYGGGGNRCTKKKRLRQTRTFSASKSVFHSM
jgi:hypothetical protein